MATYTNHYNLEKPAQTDIYNVDVFNANADKADAALYGKSDSSNIATVESSNVASKNYVVGELLVLNGILYSVTNAIATGGTITPDSNCTNTNVGNEIKTVKESLSTIGSSQRTVITGTVGTNWTDLNGTITIPAGVYIIHAQLGSLTRHNGVYIRDDAGGVDSGTSSGDSVLRIISFTGQTTLRVQARATESQVLSSDVRFDYLEAIRL